jgi:hypothetical protein
MRNRLTTAACSFFLTTTCIAALHAGGADGSPAVTLRQGPKNTATQAIAHGAVFIESKSSDVADALKSKLLGAGVNMVTAAAMKKAAGSIPFVGGAQGAFGALFGKKSSTRKGFDVRFVRGATANARVAPGPLEIDITGISVPGGDGAAVEPTLLVATVNQKDAVRIIGSYKVELRPMAPSPFSDGTDENRVERNVRGNSFATIPTTSTKTDERWIVSVATSLTPGEYVLAFFVPQPDGARLLETVIDFSVQ